MQHHEWKRPGLPMLAGEEPATEDARRLLAECLAALWGAEFSHAGRSGSRAPIAPFVRELCRASRAMGMLPEQFITVVKESWAAQPQVRRAADPDAARDRLDAIISACIHDFFLVEPASPPAAGRAAGPPA